jgi:hypothetical protein
VLTVFAVAGLAAYWISRLMNPLSTMTLTLRPTKLETSPVYARGAFQSLRPPALSHANLLSNVAQVVAHIPLDPL